MALKVRLRVPQICCMALLLLNGTAALAPLLAVAQANRSAAQQTKPLLEFRQQKRGTEAQFFRDFQLLKQLQAEQVRLQKVGNAQQQAAIQARIDRLSQQITALFEPATLTNVQVNDAYSTQVNDADPVPLLNAQPNRWSIVVQFNAEGAKRFAQLTKDMAGTGRVIGYFLKGELLDAPIVDAGFATDGITGGTAVVGDNFTAEQANNLVLQLKTQPVPTTETDRSLRLGFDRLQAQDYRGAIEYYTQAINSSPTDPLLYAARAEVQVRLKNWSLALSDYTQAIALSPQNSDFYLQRAKLYEEWKQTQQAIADYEKLIQINPQRFGIVVFQPLLLHYLELDNKNGVIALVNQFFNQLSSGDTAAQSPVIQSSRSLLLCVIQAYFDDRNQTIQLCSQALQANPNSTRASYLRGLAFERAGKLQQAKRDYQQILKTDPRETLPAFFRGNPPDRNPQFQNLQEKSLVAAYHVRGLAHYRLNDLRGAIADFNQALKLNPDYAPAYRDRGAVYKELGNLSAANQDFKSAAQRFKAQKNTLGLGSVLDLLPQKFPLTEQ